MSRPLVPDVTATSSSFELTVGCASATTKHWALVLLNNTVITNNKYMEGHMSVAQTATPTSSRTALPLDKHPVIPPQAHQTWANQ